MRTYFLLAGVLILAGVALFAPLVRIQKDYGEVVCVMPPCGGNYVEVERVSLLEYLIVYK